MSNIRVYKESRDFTVTLQPGVEDIERTLAATTKIILKRTTVGNQIPAEPIETTFGEAAKQGWLNTDRNTMEFSFTLAESEKENFFGLTSPEWLINRKTYGVKESTTWKTFDSADDEAH